MAKELETSEDFFFKIGKIWPTSSVNGKKPARKEEMSMLEKMGGEGKEIRV